MKFFSPFKPLVGAPEDKCSGHEWEADGEVNVQSAGLVILYAVVPADNVGTHKCLEECFSRVLV